jgi:septal ring factor EnvC (AmiA/AmiB activator)
VTNALKFSQEDSERIKLIKTELENTYKVIEQAQIREDKLKAKIENFQAEIKHLQDLVE